MRRILHFFHKLKNTIGRDIFKKLTANGKITLFLHGHPLTHAGRLNYTLVSPLFLDTSRKATLAIIPVCKKCKFKVCFKTEVVNNSHHRAFGFSLCYTSRLRAQVENTTWRHRLRHRLPRPCPVGIQTLLVRWPDETWRHCVRRERALTSQASLRRGKYGRREKSADIRKEGLQDRKLLTPSSLPDLKSFCRLSFFAIIDATFSSLFRFFHAKKVSNVTCTIGALSFEV